MSRRPKFSAYYTKLSLQASEMAEKLYWMLIAVDPYQPRLFRKKPHLFERRKRAQEALFMLCVRRCHITTKITPRHRAAYYAEIARGQYYYEDFGGAQIRAIKALLSGRVSLQTADDVTLLQKAHQRAEEELRGSTT